MVRACSGVLGWCAEGAASRWHAVRGGRARTARCEPPTAASCSGRKWSGVRWVPTWRGTPSCAVPAVSVSSRRPIERRSTCSHPDGHRSLSSGVGSPSDGGALLPPTPPPPPRVAVRPTASARQRRRTLDAVDATAVGASAVEPPEPSATATDEVAAEVAEAETPDGAAMSSGAAASM
eukprot:1133001-Prymnesium_polylepis.1